MIDNLTPEDRALCGALDAFVETHTEIVGNIEDAATRIIELSRQLHAAEADAARLAEALGEAIEGLEDSGKHTYARDCAEALASHTARLIDG